VATASFSRRIRPQGGHGIGNAMAKKCARADGPRT
jgi:hypothetical protein